MCYPLWVPGLGIIKNKSSFLKSLMAHEQYVQFLKVCQCRIQLLDQSIAQEICMFTQSLWRKGILMFWTLLALTESATSSSNIRTAMPIRFGSLMNFIRSSKVQLKTYCMGHSNSWKLDMSRINLTIDSHQYHNILALTNSVHSWLCWIASHGRELRSETRSEQWQGIALQSLTALRMTGKLQQKQPLMKW